MTDPWLVLAGIAALAVGFVLVPVVAETFRRLSPKRWLGCPETGSRAEVGLDAAHAALTAAYGHPRLRVKTCSLWPERQGCRERCLGAADAEDATLVVTRAS